MEVRFALCAQGVIVDRLTNQLSIFNVRSKLITPSLPLWIPELSFVTILEREANDPERYETKVIVSLDGNRVMEAPIFINFKNATESRAIINFNGIPISNAGMLTFEMEIGEGKIASVRIPIEFNPPVFAQARPAQPATSVEQPTNEQA